MKPASSLIKNPARDTWAEDYSILNKYQVVEKGSEVAILGLGNFFHLGKKVKALLNEKLGIEATLINPKFITGVDKELMENLKANHKVVITLEDGVLDGGFGEKIARYFGNSEMKVSFSVVSP